MRENEFEKQVREKMDQLGFDPPDTVWTAVDKEINKEKKRRTPLFWLFFLPALLMAGGTYYLLEHKGSPDAMSKSQQQSESNKNQISPPELKSEKKDKNTEELIDKRNKPEENSTVQTPLVNSQRNTISATGKSGGDNKKTSSGGSMEKKQSGESGQSSMPEKSDDIVIDNYNSKSTQAETGNVNKNVLDPTSGVAITGLNTNKNVLDSAAGKTFAEPAANKNVKKDSVSETAVTKNKKQKTKSSSWQFGFTGGAGISNINQGLFNSVKTLNITAATNAAANPIPPNNTTTYSSSEIKPGFSFQAGAYAQRTLSRRISLSAGLNYHYYSAKIKTGDKGNPANFSNYNSNPSFADRTFYQNGNAQTFTEKYHLIELPVSANFQLNKSKKFPFVWEVGLSLGYIVSSNALYYDPNANIYIANYQQPNRMQVNAATALMIGFHLYKNEMQVGPQLQYGLTGLSNTNNGDPGHLFYGGLKISYILPKK